MSLATSALLLVAVRTQLAVDTATRRVTDGLAQRARALRDDGEDGSQVVEYALIAGVGAAICGALIVVFTKTKLLERLVRAVITTLVKVVGGWF